MTHILRQHLIFTGLVQGVGFRYDMSILANQLGITGWVRNLEDGSVEAQIQGSPEALENLIERLGKIPPIEITQITKTTIPIRSDERSFHTLYY